MILQEGQNWEVLPVVFDRSNQIWLSLQQFRRRKLISEDCLLDGALDFGAFEVDELTHLLDVKLFRKHIILLLLILIYYIARRPCHRLLYGHCGQIHVHGL